MGNLKIYIYGVFKHAMMHLIASARIIFVEREGWVEFAINLPHNFCKTGPNWKRIVPSCRGELPDHNDTLGLLKEGHLPGVWPPAAWNMPRRLGWYLKKLVQKKKCKNTNILIKKNFLANAHALYDRNTEIMIASIYRLTFIYICM